MSKVPAIVSLSGGMDSATVLAEALACEREVTCIGFHYGSKHNPFENAKAADLAAHYGLGFRLIDFEQVIQGYESNLLRVGGDIPEGHYEEESMKLTVVPARNLIFISILTGFAWSLKVEEIWLGIHAGDHSIYPDCRPEFFEAMNRAVQTGTDFKVKLMAPFLNTNKTGILRRGLKLGVPYELTRTCYSSFETACGRCGSCQERLEAFRLNNAQDPLPYLSREVLPKKQTSSRL